MARRTHYAFGGSFAATFVCACFAAALVGGPARVLSSPQEMCPSGSDADCEGPNKVCKLVTQEGVSAQFCVCSASTGYEDDGSGKCVWIADFCLKDHHCKDPLGADKVCDKSIKRCICPPASQEDAWGDCIQIPGKCSSAFPFCDGRKVCSLKDGKCVECVDDDDCKVDCDVPGSGISCEATSGRAFCFKNKCGVAGTIDLPDWGPGPGSVPPSVPPGQGTPAQPSSRPLTLTLGG